MHIQTHTYTHECTNISHLHIQHIHPKTYITYTKDTLTYIENMRTQTHTQAYKNIKKTVTNTLIFAHIYTYNPSQTHSNPHIYRHIHSHTRSIMATYRHRELPINTKDFPSIQRTSHDPEHVRQKTFLHQKNVSYSFSLRVS